MPRKPAPPISQRSDMNEPPGTPRTSKKAPHHTDRTRNDRASRQARLADAMRENLKKRKQQTRNQAARNQRETER